MDRHVAARIATLLLLLLLAAAATTIATADGEAQGRKLSFLTYQRSPDGSIQRLFGILGRGEDAVSFAAGMTDGDANLMVRSLEDDVEYRGSGTVTQTMVRASSEEGSGAFGIAIGRASTEGDEEARVETEAGAETFGRGMQMLLHKPMDEHIQQMVMLWLNHCQKQFGKLGIPEGATLLVRQLLLP